MLAGKRCSLRAYRLDDAETLARIAGEFRVARWMTAMFAHPYTLEHAHLWVRKAAAEMPVDNFAIDVDGALAGGAGIAPRDGEHRGVAEFGYWLGSAYWGRGIATEAASLLAAHAFDLRGQHRLEAHVFAPNTASTRVLEKCGFVCEARMRAAYVERDGSIVDGLMYARLSPSLR